MKDLDQDLIASGRTGLAIELRNCAFSFFTTTSGTFSVDLSFQLSSSCLHKLVWATGFCWESEGKEVGT